MYGKRARMIRRAVREWLARVKDQERKMGVRLGEQPFAGAYREAKRYWQRHGELPEHLR